MYACTEPGSTRSSPPLCGCAFTVITVGTANSALSLPRALRASTRLTSPQTPRATPMISSTQAARRTLRMILGSAPDGSGMGGLRGLEWVALSSVNDRKHGGYEE